MPTSERLSPELMQAALINLLIAAAPFRHGQGMSTPRAMLDDAISRGQNALAAAKREGVEIDWEGLRRLAEEADAEARETRGFRADIDG